MKSNSATLGFVYYPHKDTCDSLSENLLPQGLQAYSSINEGGALRYIKKIQNQDMALDSQQLVVIIIVAKNMF